MSDPDILFSNKLPPRRKSLATDSSDSNGEMTFELGFKSSQSDASRSDEIEPELLVEFEEIVKNTPNHMIVDFSAKPKSEEITAPILEDYIDPYSIPIKFMIEQARTEFKLEELAEQMLDSDSSQSEMQRE